MATKSVIAVVGPTACGKTALGVELAKQLNGEVISADSRVVYRELSIGTAKPTAEEMQGVPHHMIDLINPDESYNVSLYQETALPLLRKIIENGKTPIVVGGTGLYVRALLQESFFPDIPPDPTFRSHMNDLVAQHGGEYLHGLLAEKDPARAAQLHPNDHVRVIRALEIIEKTGKRIPNISEAREFDVRWVGLTYHNRDLLRERIAQRLHVMLEAGWLAEVEGIVARYGAEATALKITQGYPELVQVLQNTLSLEEAGRAIQISAQQYARRQITWFKPNSDIHWFERDKIAPNALLEGVLSTTKMA